MKTPRFSFFALAFASVCLLFTSCVGSKYGQTSKREKVSMERVEGAEIIDYASLKKQEVPTLAARGTKTRGLATAFTGTMIGLGVSAVKSLISGEKNKYKAEWNTGLKSLYFYDQLSTQGPFDPLGLQFNGFNIERKFVDKKGEEKVAFKAAFELDTSNIYEIFNNATFRLKLKDIEVHYAKAKIPVGKDKINIDVEITFNTSYINAQGDLFKNVELGKFYVRLRNAPLDSTETGYKAYYDKLKDTEVEGQSFIVPRSYGYHLLNSSKMEPSWNQGAYSIAVKVTESAKNTFVNQLVMDASGTIIEIQSKEVSDIIKNKIEPTAKPAGKKN